MEECNGGGSTVISSEVAGGGVSSRWNPTKEQISLLEGLYKQGIRTPSAEQIQQITSRLRAYGHIEGKNVFYWFQNHKARQRQKQKQESLVYINRFLHAAAVPFVPPLPSNVVCSPSYVPHGGFGYYAPYQRVLLPGGVRRPRAERVDTKKKHDQQGYDTADVGHRINNEDINRLSDATQNETLQLFPLHPTGILSKDSVEESLSSSPVISSSDGNPSSFSDDSEVSMIENRGLPFINFFSQH